MDSALCGLIELRNAIEDAGDNTGRLGQYFVANDAKLQALEGFFNDQLLGKIASAKGQGVSFGALSEGEIKTIASTIANMRNKKEANLAIVNRQIDTLRRQIDESRWAFQNWNIGSYDPRVMQSTQSAPTAEISTGGDPVVDRLLK
jgi:hypothetical protein